MEDLRPRFRLMTDVDIVYHCAATAYEGLSVFSPHLVTQNIVTATSGVVSAAVSGQVERFGRYDRLDHIARCSPL